MPTKKWTEEEEEFLKANYMAMSNAELAEKFDITKNAVQKKLARMGLKRSESAKKPPSGKVSKANTVEEKKPKEVSTESHFSLGNKLFFEDRDYEQAIEEYRQAVMEESNELINLKARYWMAESYVKILRIEEAMAILRTIVEEHEDHYLGDSASRRLKALKDYVVPTT
jgi:tetratricopeptide (TPR) repeat protein